MSPGWPVCQIEPWIFKLSPGIDSMESISTGSVAWRDGTTSYSYSVPSPNRLFKNSGTGLSYWPVRLGIDSWAPWKVCKYVLCVLSTQSSLKKENFLWYIFGRFNSQPQLWSWSVQNHWLCITVKFILLVFNIKYIIQWLYIHSIFLNLEVGL